MISRSTTGELVAGGVNQLCQRSARSQRCANTRGATSRWTQAPWRVSERDLVERIARFIRRNSVDGPVCGPLDLGEACLLCQHHRAPARPRLGACLDRTPDLVLVLAIDYHAEHP